MHRMRTHVHMHQALNAAREREQQTEQGKEEKRELERLRAIATLKNRYHRGGGGGGYLGGGSIFCEEGCGGGGGEGGVRDTMAREHEEEVTIMYQEESGGVIDIGVDVVIVNDHDEPTKVEDARGGGRGRGGGGGRITFSRSGGASEQRKLVEKLFNKSFGLSSPEISSPTTDNDDGLSFCMELACVYVCKYVQ